MGALKRVFESSSSHKRLKELTQFLSSGLVIDDEDGAFLLEHIDLIRDVELWRVLWTVLLQSNPTEHIILYCRNRLDDYRAKTGVGISSEKLHLPLRYLFRHDPSSRDSLLAHFLRCKDLNLRLAAAEELARTDLPKALVEMLDIYEAAFLTDNHEVVDSIEFWITQERTEDLLVEIRRRMARTSERALVERFGWLLKSV